MEMPAADSSNDDNSQSATVNGVINTIDAATRVVNISREAIPKWNRGPATMNFVLAPHIEVNSLIKGQTIDFTFSIINDDFVITALNNIDAIDHSSMQHMMGEEVK
jgi:Cu(I)/Ag(I) efflux system membrane fusion protein